MKIISASTPLIFLTLTGIFILGCRAQKSDSGGNGMQNLTARYNILYNAKLLLEESQKNIENLHRDDYAQLLPVFREPTQESSSNETLILDSVIKKANTIVSKKSESNYVDDAYYLIAKANFFKANFFDASEFFSYVYKSYPRETELRISSLAWKTRALLLLNRLEEAQNTIDTALKLLPLLKKPDPEVYAAYAELLISKGNEKGAIEALKKAIPETRSKQASLRWTFILAQLQENNDQKEEAHNNYLKIVKSNTSYEMAFNADLNRIRLEEEHGQLDNRLAKLTALLKGDKNTEFRDQIFHRIADLYLERQQLTEAIEHYKISVQQNTANQSQKGQTYLKLADIYFNHGDYSTARAYYDSTLSLLPPSFPSYEQIRVKSANLELLANRYRIIGREDTLQTLARLNETEREQRIGELVREQTQKIINPADSNDREDMFVAAIDLPSRDLSEGKFYFNNTTAISQGLSDFRRRWGNRPLTDNWRRNAKTASDITEAISDSSSANAGLMDANNGVRDAERLRNEYLSSIPLTPGHLRLSNERIAAAYYDIASFYKNELKNPAEAIKTFEELLHRVPESTYTPAVYYNLYLLYTSVNPGKHQGYRDLLLKKYPESAFARIIQNPNYGQDSDEKAAALNTAYSEIYELYTEKKYAEVIKRTNDTQAEFGKNPLSPQFAYLKALATGHLQKLLPFESELRSIVEQHAADPLVTPMVRQHLIYIENHREEFSSRPTALLEGDRDMDFFIEPNAIPEKPVQQAATALASQRPAKQEAQSQGERKEIAVPDPVSDSPVENAANTRDTNAPRTAASIFNLPETAEYYFVVNVMSVGVNLSPSRFGIGQFNRSKYSNVTIKHQLKAVNRENQLIFVGPFPGRQAVAGYERNILPLMKDIMKIPAGSYNTFIITKTDLEKLNTRTLIDAYVEFYKNK